MEGYVLWSTEVYRVPACVILGCQVEALRKSISPGNGEKVVRQCHFKVMKKLSPTLYGCSL